MERWEYTTLDFTKPNKAVEELNRLGANGWEAVAIVTTWGVSEMRFAHPIVLLKRPLPEATASAPSNLGAP
jgi:hypothetical protein